MPASHKKPLKKAICNDARPCLGLSHYLREHAGRGGLHARLIVNLYTMKEWYLYAVRASASDQGVALNFCPFCGKKINRRWCHEKEKTDADGR